MIFVDTNVFMYAVGRPHPLRDESRRELRMRSPEEAPLFTSAEVLQELIHAYLPVGRIDTLDASLLLARSVATIKPVDDQDVRTARDLHVGYPSLGARDLLHLATCHRYHATGLLTFDRALAGAWRHPS